VVGDVLWRLKDSGAILSRMAGSGATCFGIFHSAHEATTAAHTLKNHFAKGWVVVAKN
ncbi:MAG: 4-(cytidine 5'-diphospho)-2-C-methyl-D-erythritol kinase, partial [Alphaproteobacteria bacterium]|nr:4-(cytidine 5'-diphospho)-2-C-methyl-D-erythritol kinase [Alphaproteobacteria bacterium]